MNLDEEREKIAGFIKSGLVVLSIMLLVFCGVYYAPDAVETFMEVRQERRLPIYSVETKEKEVSLSFDVDGGEVEDILKVLKKYNVKATFFVMGSWVTENPAGVKLIASEGHDLGNRGETYERMSKMSLEECQKEILAVHKKVKELTGIDMILFRPPYGDYNNTVVDTVNDCGYYCIEWNVDSLDWKDYGTDDIVKTVLESENLGNGSIILLHSGVKYTKMALEGIINGLEKENYKIVPVSELIYKEHYKIDDDGRQMPEQ